MCIKLYKNCENLKNIKFRLLAFLGVKNLKNGFSEAIFQP